MAGTESTLVIRADATSETGVGHVMRCLTLARAWRAEGGEAVFCGRVESESFRQHLRECGFDIIEPASTCTATAAMLSERFTSCWVVVDGYKFGPEWQEALVSAGLRVMTFGDGPLLPRYEAHVILVPEHGVRLSDYEAPPHSVVLAGARYRLVREDLRVASRPAREARSGAVVIVTFGGADSRNFTRAAVIALDAVLGQQDMALVILGPLNRHRSSVEEALASVRYRFELHQEVEHMADLFARADLAVSASGGAAWEMAATGLPAILVPVAANQEPGARYLEGAGAAIVVAGSEASAWPELVRSVGALLASSSTRGTMAAAGPLACDGKGANRVCRILKNLGSEAAAGDAVLRRAAADDVDQVFRLANDPVVRRNSFSPQAIPWDAHCAWFVRRLASSDTVFVVLDLHGLIVALARYDRNGGDSAVIDVAVHPAFRGRGFGTRILRESVPLALAELGVTHLYADVLEENAGSRRCFLGAGFRLTGSTQIRGRNCISFRREPAVAEERP